MRLLGPLPRPGRCGLEESGRGPSPLLAKAQLPWPPGWAAHQNPHPFPMDVLPRDSESTCQILDVGCVGARADPPDLPDEHTHIQQPDPLLCLLRADPHRPGCCPVSSTTRLLPGGPSDMRLQGILGVLLDFRPGKGRGTNTLRLYESWPIPEVFAVLRGKCWMAVLVPCCPSALRSWPGPSRL